MSAPWQDLLPTSLEVGGAGYEIRSDYRAVLDICAALSDGALNDQERAFAALDILFPALEEMPLEHYRDALERCYWFINGGDDPPEGETPRLIDWRQDFKLIVAPVNRVIGREIRAAEYLHWWTFLAAYYEIGDCLFAQVVRIREKQARGASLDQSERKFYKKNREIVDLKNKYTAQDEAVLNMWLGK